jgi:hypothetical protein
MSTTSVDLFTNQEHAIIADWLGVAPICAPDGLPSAAEALEDLGFDGQAHIRSEIDAALASIVLERVQDALPQWASVRELKTGGTVVTLGREIKERRALRKIEVVPRHLLTINWADSGPGFSWPVAYCLTYLPLYDTHVVTQSADSPDAFGYCDFAIGHFSSNSTASAVDIIKQDWAWSLDEWDQPRWAYLFEPGLIDAEEAERMADEVWGDGEIEYAAIERSHLD